jgi:hypothetical protein
VDYAKESFKRSARSGAPIKGFEFAPKIAIPNRKNSATGLTPGEAKGLDLVDKVSVQAQERATPRPAAPSLVPGDQAQLWAGGAQSCPPAASRSGRRPRYVGPPEGGGSQGGEAASGGYLASGTVGTSMFAAYPDAERTFSGADTDGRPEASHVKFAPESDVKFAEFEGSKLFRRMVFGA